MSTKNNGEILSVYLKFILKNNTIAKTGGAYLPKPSIRLLCL